MLHLQCLEDVQSQGVIPRSDAGVDEGGVGVDVGCDAPSSHVRYQSQCFAQLLALPTQTDYCTTGTTCLRLSVVAQDIYLVAESRRC